MGKEKPLKVLFKLSVAPAAQSAELVCNCAAASMSGEQLRVVGGVMHERAVKTKY